MLNRLFINYIGVDENGMDLFETIPARDSRMNKNKEWEETVVAISPVGLLAKKNAHDMKILQELRNQATKTINQFMEIWVETKAPTANYLKSYVELADRNLDPERVIFIPANRMGGKNQVSHIDEIGWRAIGSVIEDFRQKGWNVEALDIANNDLPLGYLFFIPEAE